MTRTEHSRTEGYRVLFDALPPDEVRTDTGLTGRDRKPAPWEGSMQAVCECLSWRGAWDNLDRRGTEDELGETVYRDFPVHTRSVVATTHELLDRGVVSEAELLRKMREIRDRWTRD
ncbi:ScnB [Rhodococcus sp. NPDC058521]|uniref:ScnB n=1 Tax=Rhodococcus sp. NPDC058521 TaxID=3346536 RepID=UPI00364D5D06